MGNLSAGLRYIDRPPLIQGFLSSEPLESFCDTSPHPPPVPATMVASIDEEPYV
jgi:hypothetical protein